MLNYQDVRSRGDIVAQLLVATTEACEGAALESCCSAALAEIKSLRALVEQYRSDMRYPPAVDSRQRRVEWINSIIGPN